MNHTKPQRKFFYLLLLCVLAAAGGNLVNAADDNLHLTFTTSNAGGEYGNKHYHVVWLEDSDGNFVYTSGSSKTDNKRALWAGGKVSDLHEWWDKNPNRSADYAATTGATQTVYKTYNLDWDWRRKDGTVLPDATYQVHFLCTNSESSQNSNKAVFSITKGPDPQTVGPYADENGYKNITLTFTPGVVPVPVVTNSSATNITNDSVTLNGSVNTDSDVTIYWGDDDGGTGSWDYQVDLPGSLAGNFSADISSLLPETTYYFRCYASNVSGPDWSDSASSFMTLPATPVIDLITESLFFGEVAVGSYSDLTFDIQKLGFGDDLIVE
jgi:hypothetical protein